MIRPRIHHGRCASFAGSCVPRCPRQARDRTMLRRALLATSLVAFAHTGAALLVAGSPRLKPSQAPPVADRRYLNPLGVALSADGLRAYVALSGVDEVAEVDLVKGRTLRRFPA